MSDWEDEDVCPLCKKELILPTGKKDSPVLLIGEEPLKADLDAGYPFSGPMGALLETELSFQKIRMRDCRRTYMWLHQADKKAKECFEHGMKTVMKEASNRGIIVLIGSGPVEYFCKKSIDLVSSLRLQSPYFTTQVLIACPSPSSVINAGVGEIRLALSVLRKELENFS